MAVVPITLAATSPVAERALFGWPKWANFQTATNAQCAPTIAGSAGRQHVIYKIVISFSAAPAAALEATLADGSTTILPIEIPASATAPVALDFGLRGLPITQGGAWTLTVPAAGSGVVCTAWVCGDTIVSP